MRKQFFYLISTTALTLTAAPAFAQQLTREEAIQMLEDAREAREAALEALKKAEAAEDRARQLLGVDDAPAPTGDADTSTTAIAEENKPCSERLSADHPVCELFAKLEARDTSTNDQSPLNEFTYALGLDEFEDYSADEGIAFRLSGGKDGGYAEVGPVFTWRSFRPKEDGLFNSSSWRFEPVLRGKIGDDGVAPLATISKGDFTTGADWGFGFDLRWQLTRKRRLDAVEKALEAEYKKIEEACVKKFGAAPSGRHFGSEQCQKHAMSEGLAIAAYQKAIAPLWGVTADGKTMPPKFFAGARGTYGFRRESFFPLSDPGGTGVDLIDALPLALDSAGKEKKTFNPYSFEVYGGMTLTQRDEDGASAGTKIDGSLVDDDRWELALAGSFGWENAVRYPKNTQDVTVCYDDTDPDSPTTGFTRCGKANISVPFETDGLTAGLGVTLMPPRTRFGRPLFGVTGSYFEGTDQFRISFPLAFAVDSSNNLTAGIRYDLVTEGETPFGEAISGDDTISIFLEHNLTFPFIP